MDHVQIWAFRGAIIRFSLSKRQLLDSTSSQICHHIRAGHQLTKHPNIVGAQNARELTKMFGNQSGINKTAADALKNIMRTGTKNIQTIKTKTQIN